MCANVLTKDVVGNYIFHYLLLFGNISNQGRFVNLSKIKERREIVLNQMVLVGRLTHDITVEKNKSKDIPQENKKYAMRTWLLRLGFIGDEFKTARELFMSRLDGNCAWRTVRTENEVAA